MRAQLPSTPDRLASRGVLDVLQSVREEVTIDEALSKSIGEFGWGQRCLYLLVSLAWIPAALQTVLMVFVALGPTEGLPWSCRTFALFSELCETNRVGPTPDLCSLPRDSWSWTPAERGRSIIAEWDLVCGAAWKVPAVCVAFLAGLALGNTGYVWLGNNIGRRKALLAASMMGTLCGVCSAFAKSYWWYLVLRMATGAGVAGMATAAHALATDAVGPSWRAQVGISMHYFSAAGAALLPLLAWLLPSWRLLSFLVGAASALFLLLAPYIPESPRWLLAAGRKGEATAALAAIASVNRSHLPEQPLADTAGGGGGTLGRGTAEMLGHSRLRQRLLLLLLVCFSVGQVYYGLLLLLGRLAGGVYLNYFLGAIVELPACLAAALCVERIGRRSTLSYAMLLGGVMCGLCSVTGGSLQRALALAGKAGASAALNLVYIYTAELFPTAVRSAAVTTASQAGGLGAVAAPALIYLGGMRRLAFVPPLVFGAATAFFGVLVFALPETLGSPLPETVADVSGLRYKRWTSLKQLFRPNRVGYHMTKTTSEGLEIGPDVL